MRKIALITLLAVTLASGAEAKKKPVELWQVSRTSDLITGATSCIVAAVDRAGRSSFTRFGMLYPFVEKSSTHGLLVGVSSGGRFRLPTGQIIWRVDDRPFRTLSPADGLVNTTTALPAGTGSAMDKLTEQQQRLIAAATATSTAAAGDTARDMLRELVEGHSLLFRSAGATQDFGLPNGANRAVGVVTKDGLRPVPLDDSLRAGLATCGIPATSEDR